MHLNNHVGQVYTVFSFTEQCYVLDMKNLTPLTAEEAKRLKADTSFMKVLAEVRERQSDVFCNSDGS